MDKDEVPFWVESSCFAMSVGDELLQRSSDVQSSLRKNSGLSVFASPRC